MKRESVGLVKTQSFHLPSCVTLEHGDTLKEVNVAYETYGRLNREKSNAILICHALSGDAHAAGWHQGEEKPGWWDIIIGPGKALDTDKYFVICSNVLGGCKGTTGPSSINPDTGKPYGLGFPVVTIKDMVEIQRRLVADHLGIKKLFAVIGGSFGGMQVLQWCISYPEMVRMAVPIATSAYSSPQQIAFNEVGRRAITSDPDWNGGDYYDRSVPARGLSLARMIGHITYLSDESMHQKFGRKLQDKEDYSFNLDLDFQVESYLRYHGESFVKRFDANSYLYITKAIDYFDLSEGRTLAEAFRGKGIKAKFLVISISSDWLYPPYQSKELVDALTTNEIDVRRCEIKSNYGHDAFLLESGQMNYTLGIFLSRTSVQDVMIQDVVTIDESSSIEDAARVMMEKGVTHLPVISAERRLAGIVTAWDVSKAVAMKYTKLEEIMTRDVVTSDPGDAIDTAARKMDFNNISALPVLGEDGRLVGLVTGDGISRLISICK